MSSILKCVRRFQISCRGLLMGVLVFSLSALVVNAQMSEADDDSGLISAQVSSEKSKRRMYAGGLDEQDLEVQVNLPQPSRAPDVAARVDGDEPEPSSPAHD